MPGYMYICHLISHLVRHLLRFCHLIFFESQNPITFSVKQEERLGRPWETGGTGRRARLCGGGEPACDAVGRRELGAGGGVSGAWEQEAVSGSRRRGGQRGE
ncbi:hypothetical protein GUJ93_ZPchr0002g23105 [Zizania palustris]|uniref:Uncharacterized protein n=1 Tax=Zizania palustris TaxID=103762 RepID=A0A8J5VSN5_ZIZPA|nr:hypothetical protein GUJ93_ZPchr0002g23105 [Zizania palustris]